MTGRANQAPRGRWGSSIPGPIVRLHREIVDPVHMISRTLIRVTVIGGMALAASGVSGPASAQTASSASAPPAFSIDTGGWTGGAQGDSESGQFSHCAISRQYGNGLTLALLMSPRYELNIGLLNPAWSLLPEEPAEPGSQTEPPAEEAEEEEESPPIAQVAVDGVYEKEFPAGPVSDSILMVTTGVDDQLTDLLMRGNNLDVATDHGNYRFALTGTFNSITALRGCVDTARSLAAQVRAAAPAGSTSMTGQALVSILRNAGLEGAAVAPLDSASSPLALSFAWSLGPLSGGVHQSPRQHRQAVEIDKFTELYVDQFESTCTDVFQHSEDPSEVIRNVYALKSASMQCGDDASGIYVSLFVALDDDYYTAFFHQGTVSDRVQVDDATGRIRQLILQQAGG